MRTILNRICIGIFMLSMLFTVICCVDMTATDVVSEPQEEYTPQPEHLAPGWYTSNHNYEYLICDTTATGCDNCYRTRKMQVVHDSDHIVSLHFNMFEGNKMVHVAIFNLCSYRQVRINSNDSVEHRRNPQI